MCALIRSYGENTSHQMKWYSQTYTRPFDSATLMLTSSHACPVLFVMSSGLPY